MTTALPSQTQQPTSDKERGILKLIHLSEEERIKHHVSIDTYRTNLSVMKNERAEGFAEGLAEGRAEGLAEGRAEGLAEGRAEGLAEGRAEGLAEGRAEGLAERRAEGLAERRAEGERKSKMATAKLMKADGLPTDMIQKYTGLNAAEIDAL